MQAGLLAPSSNNPQPCNCGVAEGRAQADALAAMERGLTREKTEPFLPGSAEHLSGAEYTLQVMRSASVVIFVVNELSAEIDRTLAAEERVSEICNAQSIGAAIENMVLSAAEQGLGSLWICDTFFAQRELRDWLKTDGELYAAVAVGIPDEAPEARPRKDFCEAVEWRS